MLESVQAAADAFTLPELTPWQQRVLTTAVHYVGYPYVWGGTSEKAEAPFGIEAHGGFDCSGFVWRVYKLQAYPDGAALSTTIKGRTTYQMSGEVPKAKRIAFAKLQPADVVRAHLRRRLRRLRPDEQRRAGGVDGRTRRPGGGDRRAQ